MRRENSPILESCLVSTMMRLSTSSTRTFFILTIAEVTAGDACRRYSLRFFSWAPGKTRTAPGWSFFAATMEANASKSA